MRSVIAGRLRRWWLQRQMTFSFAMAPFCNEKRWHACVLLTRISKHSRIIHFSIKMYKMLLKKSVRQRIGVREPMRSSHAIEASHDPAIRVRSINQHAQSHEPCHRPKHHQRRSKVSSKRRVSPSVGCRGGSTMPSSPFFLMEKRPK